MSEIDEKYVALLAEKDAEIARLREALKDIRAGKEFHQSDGTSVMVDWSMGEIDQIAQFALASPRSSGDRTKQHQ